jgi:CHASE3 domain sensor protein
MEFSKSISFIFGGISSIFLMSILYFFTSNVMLKEIHREIKEINEFVKDMHEITHLGISKRKH